MPWRVRMKTRRRHKCRRGGPLGRATAGTTARTSPRSRRQPICSWTNRLQDAAIESVLRDGARPSQDRAAEVCGGASRSKKEIRMRTKHLIAVAAASILLSIAASAQVGADLVAGPGIPAGSNFAPHTPSGLVIIGPNLWAGDEAQGLHHYIPLDPNNADPINTGQLKFDINTEWSMGGGTACFPWCSVGQAAQDGTMLAYVAVWDHAKGQPGNFGGPGLWMVQFQPVFGQFSPFAGISPVAPNLGLAGDLPTAVALGPDAKLYT